MFNVVIISDLRITPLREELQRRGCVVSEIHYSAFPRNLSLDLSMVSDVVICFPLPDAHYRTGYLSYSNAKELKSLMLALPHDICMADGRKWRAIPFLTLSSQWEMGSVFLDASNSSEDIRSYLNDDDAFRLIKTAVDAYKKKVIDGFDDLGFLVKYENGRFRLGPALGGQKNLENDYYNGLADRTRANRSGLVTIDRDIYGVQYEIEQLEFLINGKKTKESDLQNFFEENLHFLASHRQAIPLPHPRFPIGNNQSLIP